MSNISVAKLALKFTILLFLINVNNGFAQRKNAKRNSAKIVQSEVVESDRSSADATTFSSLKFRNVGPSVMSGRVVDIAVNPAKTEELYVAYATGGLWYSNNNGQSLKPVFDKENLIGIGAIAVDWKSNTIWVGTGEANSSRSSYAGNGMYKSTDSGKTWQHSGLEKSGHIGRVIINPNNTKEVFVAVIGNLYSPNKERGVYKTTDGGQSWKNVLFVDDNTGVIDMAINLKNTNELFATAWYRTRRAWNFEEGGSSSGLYKSGDGGNNWKLISDKNSGLPYGPGIGRMGVAICAQNPAVLYAVVDNQNHRPDTAKKKISSNFSISDFKDISKEKLLGLDTNKLDSFLQDNYFDEKYTAKRVKEMVKDDLIKSSAIFDYLFDANTALFETPVIGAEVYRSTDGGVRWTKQNKKGLELYNTYGYYFGNISVSPADENKVVIGGYDLQLSTDGGATWKRRDNEATHADWHTTWINPTNDRHWVAGNDGGFNVTYDDGAHWFKANTPSVGQFYNIAVDNAKPYNIYGGLQDNGVWYGPSTTKDDDQWDYESPYGWKRLGGGDGMQVQVDTLDERTVYYGSQFGFYTRRNLETNRRISIYPRATLGDSAYRYNWQTPILLSRHNPDIFYYATNYLHRSFDKGTTFEKISGDLTNGSKKGDVPFGTITTVAESAFRFSTLYVGTDDGNIQRSTDGGYTWKLITNGLPKGLYVSKLTASKHTDGRLFASLNGYRNDDETPYLYVTENFGESWFKIGKGMRAGAINVVIEDEQRAGNIYVGTDNAVYFSKDAGKNMILMSGNLPPVPVHDLKIQPRENELVIATHGRSIYIVKIKDIYKATL